jgi:hypothetical protein
MFDVRCTMSDVRFSGLCLEFRTSYIKHRTLS